MIGEVEVADGADESFFHFDITCFVLLNRIKKVQECDARKVDAIDAAWTKNLNITPTRRHRLSLPVLPYNHCFLPVCA